MSENENNLDEIRKNVAESETTAEEIPEQSENETIKPKGNYKTVQQLALEYGLSKQGVILRINKMLAEVKDKGIPETDYISRGKKKTIYVLEPGLIWLAKFQAENSPMQTPVQNIDLELLKLEKSEERIKDLEKQVEDLREQLKYLQSDLITKNDMIIERDKHVSVLSATISSQVQIIENQMEQILALKTPQNAPEASETAPTQSDDKATAESPKTSFWGKLMHLFG